MLYMFYLGLISNRCRTWVFPKRIITCYSKTEEDSNPLLLHSSSLIIMCPKWNATWLTFWILTFSVKFNANDWLLSPLAINTFLTWNVCYNNNSNYYYYFWQEKSVSAIITSVANMIPEVCLTSHLDFSLQKFTVFSHGLFFFPYNGTLSLFKWLLAVVWTYFSFIC